MSQSDDLAHAADVLEYARRARDHAKGKSQAEFASSALLQDAVIRCFEVMGEAAKRVSPDFREEHPQINWSGMAGFRDVLAHAYERVDLEICWNILENHLPQTIAVLEKLVPPEE